MQKVKNGELWEPRSSIHLVAHLPLSLEQTGAVDELFRESHFFPILLVKAGMHCSITSFLSV